MFFLCDIHQVQAPCRLGTAFVRCVMCTGIFLAVWASRSDFVLRFSFFLVNYYRYVTAVSSTVYLIDAYISTLRITSAAIDLFFFFQLFSLICERAKFNRYRSWCLLINTHICKVVVGLTTRACSMSVLFFDFFVFVYAVLSLPFLVPFVVPFRLSCSCCARLSRALQLSVFFLSCFVLSYYYCYYACPPTMCSMIFNVDRIIVFGKRPSFLQSRRLAGQFVYRLGIYRSLSSRVPECLAGCGTGQGELKPVLLPDLLLVYGMRERCAVWFIGCAEKVRITPFITGSAVVVSEFRRRTT